MSNFKSCCFSILVLCLLPILHACGVDAESSFAQAQKLEADGNLEGAIVALKASLQQDPDSAEKRFMLGRLYNRTYEYAAAEKELRKTLALGNTNGGLTALELARTLRAQGKFEEILKLVQVEPGFSTKIQADLLALRGRALHVLSKRKEAAESLEAAQKLDPGNSEAALLQAQIMSTAGDLVGALAVVEKALDTAPDFYDGWTYKAEILRALNRTEDAIAAYGKVLKFNPRNAVALIRRSNLYVGVGKLDSATADAEQLLRTAKDNPFAYVQRGVVAYAGGDLKLALGSAQTALKLAPKLMPANLLAGLSHHALGQFELALPFLSAALADNPDNQFARQALAESHVRLDEPGPALKVLEPILAKEVADARTYKIAGEAYMAMGEQAKSRQFFEDAVRLAPDDPGARLRLAIAGISIKGEGGIAELQEALGKAGQPTRADEALVVAMLARRNVDQAKSVVAALEKRAPNDPITWNLRGLVLMASGDSDAAEKSFENALAQDKSFLPASKNLVQIALRRGDLESARSRIQQATDADAKNIDAWLAAADFELQLGNRDQARAALERAAALAPDAAFPMYYLARMSLDDGNFAQASEYANKALTLKPDDPALLMLTATAMYRGGNANQANRLIERMISTGEQSDSAYLQAAQFYSDSGQTDLANDTLKRGLEANPKRAALQIAWTSALVGQKRYKEALEFTRSIQSKQEKAPLGFLLEGEVHEAQRDYAAAVTVYRDALSRQSHGLFAYKVFGARARAGQPEEALKEFRAWVASNPEDHDGQAKIGDVYMALGRLDDAIRSYESAMKSGTATADMLNNLANAYQSTGDSRALAIAEAAFSAAPDSPWINDTLGWIVLEQGNIARALPLLGRASTMAPDQPELRYHLAVAYDKAGKREQALKELNALLADKSNNFASRMAAEKLKKSIESH